MAWPLSRPRAAALTLSLALLSGSAAAQWNPAAGDWGKADPDDLRVMTWNVQDGICSSNDKLDVFGDWTGLVRIVAALKPDVLLLQETADNNGNGTGGSIDSVATLETVIDLFLHGGNDPFNGNAPVTSYVQLFAPGYDLPHVFVSSSDDGFNRNVILSRYPFGDINGDGDVARADFFQLADLYSPGFTGGIRGFTHAEIDLPDGVYAGDLVVGTNHLKSGGSASDHAQRIDAAQNIAYFVDALYNGLGTGVCDPNAKVLNPTATQLPSPDTPVIIGGDWNEDEVKNGATKGPADWIAKAQISGGTSDGTDRDGTDMTYDSAVEFFSGNSSTQSSSKLDYICWQDSIATLRNSFVFNSASVPGGAMPAEVQGFPIQAALASGTASDHRPVITDFILPAAEPCTSVATDLGNGKPGTGGLVPQFSACGDLSTGGTADFLLEDCLPLTQAWLVLSFTQINAPFSGGVLVPAPDFLFGPLPVDAAGELLIGGVAGGGGPFDLFAQYVVIDPGASFGRALSNGLQVHWQP